MWSVLKIRGVSPKMLKSLTSIYNCVKGRVRDISLSQLFDCPHGLRQGCVLSPLLFSFFINELALEIESTCYPGVQLHPDIVQMFLLLFADDIALFADSVFGLQKRINVLETFCNTHHLTVNLEKTKVVVFKNGGKLAKCEKWLFGGNRLESVPLYKYLGVLFSRSLSWLAHVKGAALQAKNISCCVLKSLYMLNPLPYDLFFKIFDSKISPILLYGCEIWGVDIFKEVEAVHMFCCKRFLNVKRSTSNHVVRGECGRYPMYICTYKRVVRYWCKICKMPDNRFVKKCYNMLLLDCENGKTNWASRVKHILYSFGFGYIWEQQNTRNSDQFISEFSFRLRVSYEQEWHTSLVNSSKFSSYAAFKTLFGAELYIKDIPIAKFRSALARFRCFSHRLHIETGRYVNKSKSDRLCLVCNEEHIEDEYHFVLICKSYQNLRYIYLPHKFYLKPTVHKFNMLMSTSNTAIIRQLAVYIFNAMKLRDSLFVQRPM